MTRGDTVNLQKALTSRKREETIIFHQETRQRPLLPHTDVIFTAANSYQGHTRDATEHVLRPFRVLRGRVHEHDQMRSRVGCVAALSDVHTQVQTHILDGLPCESSRGRISRSGGESVLVVREPFHPLPLMLHVILTDDTEKNLVRGVVVRQGSEHGAGQVDSRLLVVTAHSVCAFLVQANADRSVCHSPLDSEEPTERPRSDRLQVLRNFLRVMVDLRFQVHHAHTYTRCQERLVCELRWRIGVLQTNRTIREGAAHLPHRAVGREAGEPAGVRVVFHQEVVNSTSLTLDRDTELLKLQHPLCAVLVHFRHGVSARASPVHGHSEESHDQRHRHHHHHQKHAGILRSHHGEHENHH